MISSVCLSMISAQTLRVVARETGFYFSGSCFGAFSSEVDTGSREENALKQKSRALVLIQSEPKMLQQR
jgi:hypothetical protein